MRLRLHRDQHFIIMNPRFTPYAIADNSATTS
jgi:hypothetical protein